MQNKNIKVLAALFLFLPQFAHAQKQPVKKQNLNLIRGFELKSQKLEIPEEVKENGTIIWQGFQHDWKQTPHRLNKFGSYFRNLEFEDYPDEVGGEQIGEKRSLFKVGALNDTGTVKIKGTYVKTSQLGIHHGNVKEDCISVQGQVGKASSVTCRETINLKEIGFENYDEVTVILRGFQLTASSYAAGYNTRGFGVRVIPVEHTEKSFEFKTWFYVHPEHAPDRPLAKWIPLGDDCGKCKSYSYEGRVYYTIIGINHDTGAITNANGNGTNSFNQFMKMSPGKTPPRVAKSDRQAVIVGEPDFDDGIVAMQGFEWRLKAWNKTKKDGRYIRELKAAIGALDYDSNSGRALFETNMYFSNSGIWPEGYEVSYKMWNALIQVNDDSFEKTRPHWYSGTLSKGEVSVTREVSHEF